MLKIKNEKARYLIEKYRDEFNTLHQAIMIDLDRNDKLNGEEAKYIRSRINPNLTIFYEQIYQDKNYKPLKIQRLINNEWYEIDVDTFDVIGLAKD